MTRQPLLSTLRGRLLAMMVVAIVPPVAMSAFMAVQWRRNEIAETRQNAMRLARHAAAMHDRAMRGSGNVLVALAPLAADLPASRPVLESILATTLRHETAIRNFGVLTPDGAVVASARSPGEEEETGSKPSFRRAMQAGTLAVDNIRSEADGSTSATIVFPVADESGAMQHVLFAVTDLEWLRELETEALVPPGTSLWLFDEAGTILAERPDTRKWAGRSARDERVIRAALTNRDGGTLDGLAFDSVPRLFGFTPLSHPSERGRLYVAVGIPESVATVRTNFFLRTDVASFAVAVLLAVLLASTGSETFVIRHLRALARASRRIKDGDLDVRIPASGGPLELAELGESFNGMADALQARDREITRQHDELVAQERRHRALLEYSLAGTALQDEAHILRYVSPSCARLLGYDASEAIGRSVLDFVHPDDRDRLKAAAETTIAGHGPVTITSRIRHKDGRWRWIASESRSLVDVPGLGGVLSNFRDVTEWLEAQEELRRAHAELEQRVAERTAALVAANEALRAEVVERKRAEAEAQASEARFHLLLSSVPEGIYGVDLEGRCVFCNSACLRLLGFEREQDLLGRHMQSIACDSWPSDAPLLQEDRAGIARVLHDGTGIHADAVRYRRADGTTFPAECWAYPLRGQGVEVGAVVTFLDITERKAAEKQLHTLSRVIEQAGDSVIVANRAGVIEYVNPAFVQLTGFAAEEAIGQTPRLLSSGMHDAAYFAKLWETLLSGKVFRGVITNRAKDGHLYDEDQTITPIRDGAGAITHFVSTGRDITQQKRAQEATRRLNQLLEHETTRIANMLHDEAGQFLTSAHITLSEIERELEPPARARAEAVRRDLDEIEARLRSVSHELHPRILEDRGLAGALQFRADAFERRTGVRVTLDVRATREYGRALRVLLYRLVQETLTNVARHAKARSLEITVAEEADEVVCSVRDDGAGFDVAAVLGGPSLSLGLKGMRDRVEAFGGRFDVISGAGTGTQVQARIPLES